MSQPLFKPAFGDPINNFAVEVDWIVTRILSKGQSMLTASAPLPAECAAGTLGLGDLTAIRILSPMRLPYLISKREINLGLDGVGRPTIKIDSINSLGDMLFTVRVILRDAPDLTGITGEYSRQFMVRSMSSAPFTVTAAFFSERVYLQGMVFKKF
jgi:hypothetical protein